MKVIATNKFLDKLPILDIQNRAKLNSFIQRMIPENWENWKKLNNADLNLDGNIYIHRIENFKIFYTFEINNAKEEVILLLDLVVANYVLNQNLPGQRNPHINGSINPYINGSINPNINGSINPNINGGINPNINGSINPNINGSINPNINGSINPNINGSINPNINGSINPNINTSINPNINQTFEGYWIFDLTLNKTGYMIRVTPEILLLFNLSNEFIKLAIKQTVGGYVIFNKNTLIWDSHMESDGHNGFNIYSLQNQWIGIVK